MKLDPHKEKVAKAYNLASAGYNKTPLRFFPEGAKALVDFADLKSGHRVLDVGTGTGHAAFLTGQKVGPSGRVIGIDIADDMLQVARKTSGAANVEFQLVDGELLPFDDDSFDCVIGSYCVFFFPDMAATLKEWKRVTKPGGKTCFSAFSSSAFQPQSDLFEDRIRRFGNIIPEKKRPFSWQRLMDLESISGLLKSAELESHDVKRVTIQYPLKNVDEWWDICWNSGFRGPLSNLNDAQLKQFKAEHLREVGELAVDGQIPFDGSTYLASAKTD